MRPIQFISEPIEVRFDVPPTVEKKPGAPIQFEWRGEIFQVAAKLREWHDYERRGRMAHNMRPAHLRSARHRGSWGVGRDYYRVRTARGRVFDIYYDRMPTSSGGRGGAWILFREMAA